MSTDNTVETTLENGVWTILLNRPDKLNSFNAEMSEAFHNAFIRAQEDDVRAVLLTGAGRAFCAGQDLGCLLYTSPSPRDGLLSRMPSSA